MKDFKNELLNRREVKIIIDAKSNPGFDHGIEIVSKEFKVPRENIAVRNVKGKFGRGTFLIDAFIYENVKDKERIEPKEKIKKGTEEAQVSAPVAATPTQQAQSKAEEKK